MIFSENNFGKIKFMEFKKLKIFILWLKANNNKILNHIKLQNIKIILEYHLKIWYK